MYFLLYLAGIFSAVQAASGCAHLSESLKTDSSVAGAYRMLEEGDFQGALAENEKALSQPLRFSKDRLLFQRGVIYSHPGNPDPDYFKAVGYFQTVIDEYPRSDLKDAAESLTTLVRRISKSEEQIRSLTERVDYLQNALSEQRHWMQNVLNEHRTAIFQFEGKSAILRAEVEKLIAENGHLQNAVQKGQTELNSCRQDLIQRDKQISELGSEIEEFKNHIEKLKKIDLNIEKRKKNVDIKSVSPEPSDGSVRN